MSRFDRSFKLIVEIDGGVVTIEPPFKVVFDVVKSIAGGLNKATIQIYNMDQRKRLALTKDTEQVKRVPVSLAVGYAGSVETIFKGSLQRGSNRRDGADYVTELYCLDGGFDVANSFVNTVSEGDAVGAILGAMPNTRRGKVTNQGELVRPKVLVGDAVTLLDDLVTDGQTWFIDNEALNLMKGDEVISSFIPVVSADTGLVNTPEREQSRVTFDTLMNPALKLAGLCNLRSKTAPHLDGVYRLETMTYSGDNYGQNWMQSCSGILQPKYTVI